MCSFDLEHGRFKHLVLLRRRDLLIGEHTFAWLPSSLARRAHRCAVSVTRCGQILDPVGWRRDSVAVLDQACRAHPESARESQQVLIGEIPLPPFDLADIGPVQAGGMAELLLRYLRGLPKGPHPSAECHQLGIL